MSDAKLSIVHVTCRHKRLLVRIADYLDNGRAIAIAPEDPTGKRKRTRESSYVRKGQGKDGEIVN